MDYKEIKNKLKNVYFINGTAYAGRSTNEVNGGFDCYFKTAVWLPVFRFGTELSCPQQRFFISVERFVDIVI